MKLILQSIYYIDKGLSFLEQGKGSFVLISRYKVNRAIVQLMQYNRHLIYLIKNYESLFTFIQIKLFTV